MNVMFVEENEYVRYVCLSEICLLFWYVWGMWEWMTCTWVLYRSFILKSKTHSGTRVLISPNRIKRSISVLYVNYFVFVEVANVLIRLNAAVFYEKLCSFYTHHKFLLKLHRKW